MSVSAMAGTPVPGLAHALKLSPVTPDTGIAALPWFSFEVLASAGCRPAAGRIARRVERAYWLLRQALDVAPPVRLLVLDRADWRQFAARDDFGVVHLNDAGDLVVGSEPAQAWSDLSAWLRDAVDGASLQVLLRLYGRDPDSGGPALGSLAEALVAHELAHRFAAYAGARFPRRWLDEAFANYAMVAVLGEADPVGLRRLGALAQAVETLDVELPSLVRFERAFGMLELVPSVVAQLALTRGVYQTYAVAGIAPLARMLRLFRAGIATDKLPDHEIARLLGFHAHPTLAAIPSLFPAARLRAAA
ncbi:MAG TPA: hypothetical protein VLR71_22205 [Casimicrobiaceae bacterium]|nr:hypothetical protein [Casimicrobiaceae bacterium]